MKLSQFKFRCKMEIPTLKETGLNDTELTGLINEGVDQANLLAQVYKGYTNFDTVVDLAIYQLSQIAPTFLGMTKQGLWIKDSGEVLQPLLPKTEKWLNDNIRYWRNASSVDLPQYYAQEADDLIIYPPCNTSTANGGRIYHLKKGNPMANDDHYPFSGSDTELTALKPLDEAIIAYVKWKVAPVLVKETMEDKTEKEFEFRCSRASRQIKKRPDATSDNTNYMRFK